VVFDVIRVSNTSCSDYHNYTVEFDVLKVAELKLKSLVPLMDPDSHEDIHHDSTDAGVSNITCDNVDNRLKSHRVPNDPIGDFETA